ncbi:MAG: hypothetical protein Q4D21_06810 [Phascolarctobacterium sp.]|nr:hypothetical protein [Phascolarctobacterium sp.]
METKFKFGGAILVILLGFACIVGGMQVFSPPTEAQEKKLAKPEVYINPKLFDKARSSPVPSASAKLRNPFVPQQLTVNVLGSRLPNLSQSQVPNASTLPVLRGIMEQSGRQFAIIEYNNQSHICALGNNVGSYTLTGLTAFSVFLEHNGQVIELKLGKKK